MVAPRGPLREAAARAVGRAHVVVLHHAPLVPAPRRRALLRQLLAWAPPHALVTTSAMRIESLVAVPAEAEEGEEELAVSTLRGAVVLAVSGVGSPAALAATLEHAGAAAVHSEAFNDHHPFDQQVRCAPRGRANTPGESGHWWAHTGGGKRPCLQTAHMTI